jgi:hypothetical protein
VVGIEVSWRIFLPFSVDVVLENVAGSSPPKPAPLGPHFEHGPDEMIEAWRGGAEDAEGSKGITDAQFPRPFR